MALKQKHDCEGAYFALGLGLNITDRLEEAAQVADEAIEFNGDDYNVYVAYANTFKRLGDEEMTRRLRAQLLRVLQMHLEWAPDNVRARVLLASSLIEQGRHEEGLMELQKVLEQNPDDAGTLYNAACALSILGQKGEAIQTLKRAIANGYWHPDTISRDADFK